MSSMLAFNRETIERILDEQRHSVWSIKPYNGPNSPNPSQDFTDWRPPALKEINRSQQSVERAADVLMSLGSNSNRHESTNNSSQNVNRDTTSSVPSPQDDSRNLLAITNHEIDTAGTSVSKKTRGPSKAWNPNEPNEKVDKENKHTLPSNGERFVKNVAAFLDTLGPVLGSGNRRTFIYAELERRARPFMHHSMFDSNGHVSMANREDEFCQQENIDTHRYRYLRARVILGLGLIIEQNARAFTGRLRHDHPSVVSNSGSGKRRASGSFWRCIQIGRSQAQMLCPGFNVNLLSRMYENLQDWVMPTDAFIVATSNAQQSGVLKTEVVDMYGQQHRQAQMDDLLLWENAAITEPQYRVAIRLSDLEHEPGTERTINKFEWPTRKSSQAVA